MTDNLEGLAKLREPFPGHQINLLPKPKFKDAAKGKCAECDGFHGLPAVHLSYVGHAAITDRLLDVDPEWSWVPLAVDECGLPKFDGNGGLWIKLTILGVTRLGYGDAQGKRGGDAVKEAIGDALRNAALRYGAALDLWHKGDLHNTGDSTDQETTGPSAQDLADEARSELLALLKETGYDPKEANVRFAADGHGDIQQSADVAAIKGLTAHYRKLAGQA